MLVLKGKAGDKITIGDNVEITFLGDHRGYGGQYKLGFVAPESICILREKAKVRFKKPKTIGQKNTPIA